MGEISERPNELVEELIKGEDIQQLASAKFILEQEVAFHKAMLDLDDKENQDTLIRQTMMGLETIPYIRMKEFASPEQIIMIHRYFEQGLDEFEFRDKILEPYRDEPDIKGDLENSETLLTLVNARLSELGYDERAINLGNQTLSPDGIQRDPISPELEAASQGLQSGKILQ